jgi:phage-related protein
MAERKLNIILDLKDRASAQLQGFQGRLESMKPTFQKMAIGGAAAFTGISVGLYKVVNSAGDAEKAAMNLKNTFGESTDEINNFISDFGGEFAFLETDLKKGASSIGFQIGALGDITKEQGEEMTKSLLTASGGLSDFFGNQLNVADAANAMAKALAGNTGQLIDMGYNIRTKDIEKMAESMGYANEELTQSQKALAITELIMEQTQGSIGGLSDSMDTYTGQQRAFRKATTEAAEKLGGVFLPTATKLLQKITPIIGKMADWIKENPKLTATIVKVTIALTGIVTVLGTLGLLLLTLTPAIAAMTTVFVALLSPIALVSGAIVGLVSAGWYLVSNWESIKETIIWAWEIIKTKIVSLINSIWTTIISWLSGITVGIRDTFLGLINFVKQTWDNIKNTIISITTSVTGTISDWVGGIWDAVTERFTKIKEFMSEIWEGIVDIIKGSINNAIGAIEGFFNSIVKGINSFITKMNQTAAQLARLPGVSRPPRVSLITSGVELPRLHNGGIIDLPANREMPIMARGQEAIVPLDKGFGNINITINGDVSGEELIQKVTDGLAIALNRQIRI